MREKDKKGIYYSSSAEREKDEAVWRRWLEGGRGNALFAPPGSRGREKKEGKGFMSFTPCILNKKRGTRMGEMRLEENQKFHRRSSQWKGGENEKEKKGKKCNVRDGRKREPALRLVKGKNGGVAPALV